MESVTLGNNCYRAILAQVNCLEAVWPEQSTLKQIYEELSELAFYMLEQDRERVRKGIDQIITTLDEAQVAFPSASYRYFLEVKMIVSELRTHLHYLRLEYK
jgi:hypothetical protein